MDSRRPQPVGCSGKNDSRNNGARDDNATLADNVFHASTRNVILQCLMPLYRLRQTGESMTLLPTATHIDIAAAMALWILGWHILWGLPPKYDNESNGNLDDNATLAANVFYASTLNVIL